MGSKKIIAAVTGVALLVSASKAGAVSWANFGNKEERKEARTEFRNQMQESKDTMLEEREKLREEVKAGSLEAMKKVGSLHGTRLEKRFSFYYSRLKGIYDRLGTRITALEAELGTEKLAKAKSLWTQAGQKLEEARTKGTTVVGDFRSVEGSDLKSQRTEVVAARESAKQTLTLFKDATKLMKDAAKEVRTVVAANKPSPTPKGSIDPNSKTRRNSPPVKQPQRSTSN